MPHRIKALIQPKLQLLFWPSENGFLPNNSEFLGQDIKSYLPGIYQRLSLETYHAGAYSLSALYSSHLAFIKCVLIFQTIHRNTKLIRHFCFLAQEPIPYNNIILNSGLAMYSTQWCVRVKMSFIKPKAHYIALTLLGQAWTSHINLHERSCA